MSKNDSKLLTKVSSLIPGQVPEFVESDHSLFVKFLKDYYQYLEAGRITLSTTINYVTLETTTVSYVLDETSGDRIVTEIGEGTLGQFIEGETITGGTSNASATVLVDDSRNKYIYISSQQKFITGEVITGATSGSTATISEYRANPVQNIQQLLEYANVDNTIFDFLEQFRKSFMNAIPSTLASGVSKRNLTKNIKDLYAAKGTSEATKLFMKVFLGEDPTILYPNQYMMKVSDGNFGQQIILRTAPDFGVTGDEVINQLITGVLSGASATVESAVTVVQGGQSITELRIANPTGTFTDGERVTGNSISRDVSVGFTVRGIVSDATVVNDGILHSNNEILTVEAIGNESAEVVVDQIKKGSVSGVEVDDVGSLYEVGDTLTFTPVSADTDVKSASGFVSMVGGGIQLESGALDDLDLTDDAIILESRSTTHLEPFSIILESVTSDKFRGDGETATFTLTNLNDNNDIITLYVDNLLTKSTNILGNTVFTLSGTTLTFTDAPVDGAIIYLQGSDTDSLLLDGTDGSSTNAGHQIITEIGLDFEQEDTHTTLNDQIVLEFDTLSASEAGAIQKVHISDGGGAYSDLPDVTITTTTGTSASLLSVTDDIGAIDSLQVKDSGFNYSSTNPPDLTARAHFVLKDVTGTFANTNTLTTHVGTVKGFDSNTNILDTTFENVVRVEQEQDGTFNEGIDLEDGTVLDDNTIVEGIELEDEQDIETQEDDNIVLEGTEVVTPTARFITHVVKVVRNTLGNNVYLIDGVEQPTLVFTEGDIHYFDLSDSSLYNAVVSKSHIFQLSITSNGSHASGTEYTTGVTKSASYIDTGTTGAFLQIVVASGTAPNPLFYYCVNHSGMGGRIETREVVTFVRDANSNLLLDGSATTIFNIQLEDSLDNGFIREEASVTRAAHIILEDELNSTGNFSILLEDGEQLLKEGSDTVDITTSTDFGGTVLLERTTLDELQGRDLGDGFVGQTSDTVGGFFVQDDGGIVLIDRVHEVDLNGRLLLDGINSDGLGENQQLATENAGRRLVLNGTDSDGSNENSLLTFENETGEGDIVLDGTDSDSADAGDNIINEIPIDFSNKNVTITDSSGASGTIVKADIATATSSVTTTATTIGEYSGIRSLMGEDLNRIQDSYYYQDYSYEVQVGAAFSDYVNELKKSVHPAGFRPFGKVSIASLVSVAVTNTGAGVQSFVGDDRFSPILASTFETIFDQSLQMRTSAKKYEIGTINDQIVFEDGVIAGDKLVLDASSTSTGSTTPADVSIILEDSLQPSGYGYNTAYIVIDSSASGFADEGGKLDLESGSLEDEFENILLEDSSTISLEDGFHKTGDSILFEGNSDVEMQSLGGRMMSENSLAPSGQSEKHVVKLITTKLTTKPAPRITRNLLIYLAETPFGLAPNSLQLENSTFGSFESGILKLDGHAPLNEPEVPISLESPTSHIVLNGTDSSSSNAGETLLTEEGDFIVNEETEIDTGVKDRLLLETGGDNALLAESDRFAFPVGFVVDEDERIVLEDYNNDSETISIDEIGNLRFNDILRSNKLIMELGEAKDVSQIILLEDDVDGDAEINRLVGESGGFVDLEESLHVKFLGSGVADQNNANAVENVGILLENFGQLQLDGTDSDSTDAGDYMIEETTKVNRFSLELSGSIIEEDLSTISVVEHLVLEDQSGGRILHEIVVDSDAFDHGTGAFDRPDNILLEQGDGDIIVLDGTNSSSDNAGHALLFESSEEIVSPIALETTNRINSEGQIPLGNWTLNSRTSSVGGQPIVRSSEIRTRTTGDIALEDGIGNLVLNGTDGSSTNAGNNLDLEGATGITI